MPTNRFAFTRTYNRTKHATRRARQRYGFDLSPAIAARIVAAIEAGNATPMGRDVYRVDLRTILPDLPDTSILVAMDGGQIASILPPDWTIERAEAHDLANGRERREPEKPVTVDDPTPRYSIDNMGREELVELRVELRAQLASGGALRRIEADLAKVNARLASIQRKIERKVRKEKKAARDKARLEELWTTSRHPDHK